MRYIIINYKLLIFFVKFGNIYFFITFFSVSSIFEKSKKSIITVEPQRIFCDICNGRCKRGMAGNSPNTCTNVETLAPTLWKSPLIEDTQKNVIKKYIFLPNFTKNINNLYFIIIYLIKL